LRCPSSSAKPCGVKLSRVEIRGFKSIAKKTVLSVSDGVTGIAGPNGCGKSNIIDAIRWALGEQSARSLRAAAMGDVVFSGTQEVGPSSMASVTIEFIRDGGHFPVSLEGFDHIAITRRLFRSGESEYLINNVKSRLKDITDLFLDTGLHRNGYAIIEQGKVKDIIQSKPDEMRYLIEEAAEVGRFRVKRAEALRRLEATSKNLERIRDLLNEVTRQKNELKSQANKARRYQELRSSVNDLSRILAACDLEKIAASMKAQETELTAIDSRIAQHEEEYASLSEKAQSFEGTSNRLKADMETLASSLSGAESRELLAIQEIEACESRLKDIVSTIEMLVRGVEEDKEFMEDEQIKAVELKRELDSLLSEIQGIQEHIWASEAAHAAHLREYEDLEEEYNGKRIELFDAIGEVRALEQRLTEIQSRCKEMTSTIRKRQQDLSSIVTGAENLKKDLATLEAEISSRHNAKPLLELEIQDFERMIAEAGGHIETDTLRLIALEKSHAEISAKLSVLKRIGDPAPETLAAAHTQSNGNRRVSDMLSVHVGFEEAVGRSMGNALDFLIYRDHDEILAQEGFETNGPGFVIERPHIHHHAGGPPPGSNGVLGPLNEFIDAREGYQEVAEALSQNMWVVDTLESALRLWRQGHRTCSFVTREGMILEPTGVIRTTRELTKYAEVLKAKTEMRDLSEKMLFIEGQIAQVKAGLDQAKKDLQDLKNRHAAKSSEMGSLERDIATLMEWRQRIVSQQEHILEQDSALNAEITQMVELSAKFEADAATLADQKAVLEEARAKRESIVKDLNEKKQASKQGLMRSQEEMQAKMTHLNDLKMTSAAKGERIKTLEGALVKRREEIEKDERRIEDLANTRLMVEQSLTQAQKALECTMAEITSLKASYAELLPEYEKALGLLRATQEERQDLRSTIDQIEKARGEILLKKREHDIAYAMNLERLEARFGEGIPEIPETFDSVLARREIAALEERIEKMGQINFASIEAFEHVQKRWDDLHRQYEDIVRASTRLKEVIANIERQSTKAFMATFNQVKKNFQDIFTTMFGGGKADIIFTEGGDDLEAGVEIFASPPFKRLKSMSLLSEGEKTLCAISFIFALFKVNPSPFCILDEVDAPLDDANVIRLNRLIRSFSQDSQFIVVTHNRYTMEMADILYGVTFDVPGISKVVSMVLEEAQG
jgi:chromosome segregation protein